MTSLDSSTVGCSKVGNGGTGVPALTLLTGLTGADADSTGERDRFMLYDRFTVAD